MNHEFKATVISIKIWGNTVKWNKIIKIEPNGNSRCEKSIWNEECNKYYK